MYLIHPSNHPSILFFLFTVRKLRHRRLDQLPKVTQLVEKVEIKSLVFGLQSIILW